MTALPKRDEGELIAISPFSDYETGRRLVVENWGDDALIIGGKPYATADMRMLAAYGRGGALMAWPSTRSTGRRCCSAP